MTCFHRFARGWKTLVFNIACSLVLLTELLGSSPISSFLPPEWQLYWSLFVVGGNVVLRWLTTGPMAGMKPEEAE